MVRRVLNAVGGLVIALVALSIVFMTGMRRKSPPVLRAVRRVNRAVFNPMQMESAGSPGAYAAIIRHEGRNSGKPYETPVGAVATADGFVIALPYGRQADWLKNVLAAGSATVVHDGDIHAVDSPAVVPITSVAAEFSAADLRAQRMFGVDECLLLRRVDPT